jgi:hypothetical protein
MNHVFENIHIEISKVILKCQKVGQKKVNVKFLHWISEISLIFTSNLAALILLANVSPGKMLKFIVKSNKKWTDLWHNYTSSAHELTWYYFFICIS